jgi:ABC-type transporter Mla MlaB component
MKKNSQLSRQDNSLVLQGRLTYQTVNDIFRHFKHELEAGIDKLDCGAVGECDSSAVSFLLACHRLAGKRDINLEISGLSEQILSLARLYEVDNLLVPKPAGKP